MRKTKILTLAGLTVVTFAVITGIAAAETYTIGGEVVDANGNPIPGVTVQLYAGDQLLGEDTTNGGDWEMTIVVTDPPPIPVSWAAKFWYEGTLMATVDTFSDHLGLEYLGKPYTFPPYTLAEVQADMNWQFQQFQLGGGGVTPIPEFPTIALPIASILGLLFFFNLKRRKR